MLLMRRSRFDEALLEGQTALSHAPLSARFEEGIGEVYVFSERYDEALAMARKLLASDSTFIGGYRLRGLAYLQQGKFEEAAKVGQDCHRVVPACDDRSYRAYVDAVIGRQAEALKVVDTLEAQWKQQEIPGIAMDLATVYAGLGEKEKALGWLERGTETHAFMGYVGIEPTYSSLRGEPRFKAVLKKIGLPE
jgi:tetratricopeptide (TPR) repeat protein